ncbi:hypothetical protein AKJ45_03810 [candidate division MSBL1 archaeon SCGC-AAA261F19]|uniref:DNA-directed RNA polymerase subunit Rpo11 n=1 Tax=candidate division MSBL1 archaeon SCGC-AAA261F19 TaxID=1698275 RepID=A0A133V6B6_9EURY|nr:hypothetical protein AKJ45_03810 [candidate division MSBL1 archaeon SCGC-AAA261F19]
MELELVEKCGTAVRLKIRGEGHTFCNVLRKKLHEDDRVETAAYSIDHPLLEHPEMYIKVKKGKSPKRALIRAAKKLVEDYEEVQKKMEKALKDRK